MKSPLLMAGIAVVSASCTQALPQILQTRSGPIQIESLAQLDNPWGMTFLPDGRLLITEKPGRVRIFSDGKLSQSIQGVPEVAYGGQGGLLDVEIDPGFASNSLIYLYYAELSSGDQKIKGGAVARGKLENNQLTNLSVIWRQDPKTTGNGHFGGRFAFARDGTLFITSGERQKFDPAQDSGVNLGKIIRINPDGSIPKDNPFVNRSNVRPDIWSLGHRNPLGLTFHPTSGELWENEMGPLGGDEVNRIQKGGNYGWPKVSEGSHYSGMSIPRHSTRPEFIAPVQSWNPSISPSGLLFYTGERFRAWQGNLLLGGLSSRALIRLTLEGNKVTGEERLDMGRRIRDLIQAPDGAVLLLTDGNDGELLRLTPQQAS